ncbi:hypothetical protein Taro_006339 [Colocasia esculenta]|uniref:Uncharacterized protein n=1 Tax=Colocasia esculenta TaxID=4460 RepID=A0A843TNF0_COLES|nr:hypothetical protein [Colocasia esculenta]
MLKKGKVVGSDDSTQSPDDDDGAAAVYASIHFLPIVTQYHPINKKEAKGKHKNNMGDMKANKGKQGMIGDMGILIHLVLVRQNCHIQISALVVGQVIWAIFKLLSMVVSSLQDNQEKVQANKQRHLDASKGDSKTSPILCLALDIPSMGHLLSVMRQRMRVKKYQIDKPDSIGVRRIRRPDPTRVTVGWVRPCDPTRPDYAIYGRKREKRIEKERKKRWRQRRRSGPSEGGAWGWEGATA